MKVFYVSISEKNYLSTGLGMINEMWMVENVYTRSLLLYLQNVNFQTNLVP